MKISAAALLAATVLAAASLPPGVAAGTPTTYANLTWSAAWAPATSLFASCTQLKLDSTGDMSAPNATLAMHGSLACLATANTPARTYGVTGTAYFTPDGQFNISLILGNGTVVQCMRWGATTGICQVSDVAGSTSGTVQLTLA